MRKCIRCGKEKQEGEFNIRNIKKGYLQSVCRECQKQDNRDRYANNKERVRAINKISRFKMVEAAKDFISSFLTQSKCVDCGESDSEVLTFDHVKGRKRDNVSSLVRSGYSIETIKEEISVCEIVCFNCHMKRERKRRR